MKHVEIALNLSWVLLFIGFVQAQQPESLNIACGATSSYVDNENGWEYNTDNDFIESGTIYNVPSILDNSSFRQSYWNLRSFPSDKRNCYRLKSIKGSTYLVQATYVYGNYDNLNRPPQFDLYFGTDYWTTVNLANNSSVVYDELITVAASDLLFLCLINTGRGTPIISEIRLVTLPNDLYGNVTSSGTLLRYDRVNTGSNETVSYPDDIYDRQWDYWNLLGSINTTNKFTYSKVPSKVLQTASVPEGNESFSWVWNGLKYSTDLYHIVLHFAELEKLKENESREFNIYQEDSFFYGPLQPTYLNVTTVYSKEPLKGKSLSFSLIKTNTSTRIPLLNAYELFLVMKFSGSATNRQDVDAIMGIKSTYQIKQNWMGDPCLPKNFSWSGLTCSHNDSPRIIALNLSFSGLVGNISNYLANISSIEYIDLSNNNLTGTIPEFLAQLTSLKEVNLSNNSLSGSIPNSLTERMRNGFQLRADNNPSLVMKVIENHKQKKGAIVAVIISVTLASFILSVALIISCIFRRKNRHKSLSIHNKNMPHREFEIPAAENKIFTYSEVLRMTNNFENIIGRGGFGFVYSGSLDGMKVAVKVLSESSKQGSKEFSTEIKLLMKIHHKNLVSLVGYCHEDSKMVLIYENMEGGNLRDMLLSGSSEKSNFLSWKQRLHIALDAAQGLEYLHHGCKPPIIHRDVKTANILLNGRLEAKVADFGLSRVYPADSLSYLSTAIVGTIGYVDPEYILSRHLNEKCDVYSFGVVLLELFTGEPPSGKNFERIHVVQYVKSMVQKGEIREVIDPRLNGECDINSAWKFAEIALECTLQSSVERPSMRKVANELKECLIQETNKYKENETKRYIISDQYLDTEPPAR